jgi:hypothetical protein
MARDGNNKLTFGRIALLCILAPLYALYGCIAALRALPRLARRLRGLQVGLADEVRCPNGHPNPTTGRFNCASCRAEYHGWIGRCALCRAPAGWTPCETCGVAIRLPWARTQW